MSITTSSSRLAALTLALGALDACDDPPAAPARGDVGPPHLQAVTSTENVRVPLETLLPFFFVDCANGGEGELIDFSGDLHILFHTTLDETGAVHVKSHSQPQGVTAVGRVTGDVYRGAGVTQSETRLVGGLPVTDTFINNFLLIGPGPGNNLLIHHTVHLTINANGEVTAEVENFRPVCK